MELAFLAVTFAALAGSDRIDRGGFLDHAGGKPGEEHDDDDDDQGADGVDADAEAAAEHHVLRDGSHQEVIERDTQEEAEDRADDGHAQVLREVQAADLSVLDADGLHDADLSIFLRDSERKRNLKYDEGQDDQADGERVYAKYSKGADGKLEVTLSDKMYGRMEKLILLI